ncbi:hypothetical protein CBR_g39590 [Chara braunii]|uniref:DUF1343 domain-containing protein n=1 Tax=Chara braunii TaxID=69332 RepID=A0A388K188_CHABU|nr:hypothetical protein CBR_g39590 [Chara braunii]|eukprot:GBG63806.1 hypothetical protein CBR_g39590 [Chara braunii]
MKVLKGLFGPSGDGGKVGVRTPVKTGIEVISEDGFRLLQGGKVGIIANATSVFPDMRHLVDVLFHETTVDLCAIFGPEHGFRGCSQAGSSPGAYTDPATKLPVFDIHAKKAKDLLNIFLNAGVDIILFDIQDVGARFYTYVWTLYDSMVAIASCTSRHLRLVVADRPNPLGGSITAGPVLRPELGSFVGRKAIALQHGMTVGELAILFNSEFVPVDGESGGKRVDLEVVRMVGWKRCHLYGDTGLIWVPPSPNMPSPTTALLYPGMGLIEGTNCSEGRGTTLPFEMIGSPWIDRQLVIAMQQEFADNDGVLFREAVFTPTFSKHAGKMVSGMQVHVANPTTIDPIRIGITLLVILRKLYPDRFAWRKDGGKFWIDYLTGSENIRKAIDDGRSVDEILASWQEDLLLFCMQRHNFLLYK